MEHKKIKSERGIALLVVLFALVLVTAIGLALMFSTNGDASLNSGYRQSNLAYFGARSGVEELRDRIRLSGVPAGGVLPANAIVPPAVPIGQPGGVVYVTNLDANETGNSYFPWIGNAQNPYFDDELCHEIANSATNPWAGGAPNKRCGTGQIPPGNAWYVQQPAQALPNNDKLSYKWARVNLKMNESSAPWC